MFVIGGTEYPEGTELSVDGATGEVYAAQISRVVPESNLHVMAALLGWADEASGATTWVAESKNSTGPVGVVALTDLLLATDTLDVLIDALDALSTDANAAINDRLGEAIQRALDPLLAAALDRPVDLRLPVLTSARARRTIGEWASLAPELLHPLGSPALLDVYLDAIAAAAARAGHKQVTVHLGGATDATQITTFVERLGDSGLAAGAVLANAAVLARPALLHATGAALWVDLPELIRTACGRPAELLFTPDEDLPPLVEDLLVYLAAAGSDARLGVDLSGGSVAHLAPTLHRWGYRHFATSAGQAEALRLVLGQAVSPEKQFEH